MEGLDLCRRYYYECVKHIIEEKYPLIKDNYSCALIGWGSDVLQNDDEYSKDHEWGPRLLIFVDEEHQYAIPELEAILNKYIPFDFLGYSTRFNFDESGNICVLSPTHEGFVHIDFYIYDEYIKNFLGILAPERDLDWLCIPENKLLEITSGEIFYDPNNTLQEKLKVYKNYYPLDVWKYRMAYLWLTIGWNIDIIGLCNKRRDTISEKIAIYKTIIPLIKIISAYNKKYSPSSCKWIGTEFYKLPNIANETGQLLEKCLETDDVLKVKSNLEKVIEKIIAFHNSYSELPNISIEKPLYGRGFWDINCENFADTIYESIQGELRKIPLHGAVDQFVIQEDFLIFPELLKKLNNIYSI